MKIEEIRPSFTVYLIASDLDQMDGIAESLGLAGYMVASFSEVTAAFSEFPSNPPHMLVFSATEDKFDLAKVFRQVANQLPESHVFLATPVDNREKAVAYLDHGVYDLIYLPVKSTTELLKPFDRAAERDYFMYLNERLVEGEKDAIAAQVGGAVNLATIRKLFDQRNPDDSLQLYLRVASGLLGNCPAIYFKFIANRRVIMATHAEGIEDNSWRGLGVDFNASGDNFRTAHLREPAAVPEIQQLVTDVFNKDDFVAYCLEVLGEIQGVAVFLGPEPDTAQSKVLEDWLQLVTRALSQQEAERRLHVMTVKDPATDLLNRQNFLTRVSQEISRARRTSTALSLALMAVDQYGQIVSQVGQEEAQVILRMIARIIEKHSRINDLLGRTGSDEFGLLLPHTGSRGALIKVERLRKIIESADFSRVLKSFPQITVSIGVAEYPGMVRDADELIQLADEALFQVREQGNKTCVAKPPDGFVADFQVQDKGLA